MSTITEVGRVWWEIGDIEKEVKTLVKREKSNGELNGEKG